MPGGIRVELRCEDGAPFPVVFASEEDAAASWVLEREHSMGPAAPLPEALSRLGRPGAERAYHESGLPCPRMWDPGPDASGFAYFRLGDPDPEEMAKLFAGCAVLVERYGSSRGIWRDYSLPKVKEVCDRLGGSDETVPLAVLAEQHDYGFQHTMISAMVSGNDMRLIEEVCAPLFGDQAGLICYELAQGYLNDTVSANQELWQLGRMISRSAGLTAAVESSDARSAMGDIRARGDEPEFFVALDGFLGRVGGRAETWSISSPTWSEEGAGFWAQLRQMARPDAEEPERRLGEAGKRRCELIDEIDAKLAGDEQLRARFHRRVGRLADYVVVREERANWQLMIDGALRQALLQRGQGLMSRGRVDAAEDVLFLLPGELDQPDADLRSIAAARRAEHDRRRGLRPPQVIGAPPSAPSPTRGPDVIASGTGASRGLATGPARIVGDLGESDRFEPGDVLVCQMTAPPWTPLFGLAAAVVVDTGGLGSHAAIAAREYGIPCVIGTRDGTTAIMDGALVTVDGSAGTVILAASVSESTVN